MPGPDRRRTGTFSNGMVYATWGDGPRTALFIPGGPGSAIPPGVLLALFGRRFQPYRAAGFTVWIVTRRRHMPAGHTVADMADDYAEAIADGLGGRVDLVVGESYGGMVAQYLAALHPDRVARIAIVASGAEVTDWGKTVDNTMARGFATRDATAAGSAVVDTLLPRQRYRWLRRPLSAVMGRLMLLGYRVPPQDVLTEAGAEEAFDSRAVLPRIQRPVLLICGDRDRFVSRDVVEETARLIPHCVLRWYAGRGHVRTIASRQVPADVLAFVEQT